MKKLEPHLAPTTESAQTPPDPARHELKRELAAERGRSLGILFRPRRAAVEPSGAVLRLALERRGAAVRVTLLKGRGARGVVELDPQA